MLHVALAVWGIEDQFTSTQSANDSSDAVASAYRASITQPSAGDHGVTRGTS